MLLLLIGITPLFAEDVIVDSTSKKIKANRYTLRNLGVNKTLFRDFATSPLFYRGGGISFGYGWLNTNNNRERLVELDLVSNVTTAKAPKSNYFQTGTTSFFFNINGYIHYLHKVKSISTAKTDIRFGGAVSNTQNIRFNPSLMNATAGLESFLNLMFAGKVSRDISRNSARPFKFLFIKKELQPVKRFVSFQLNAGILNLNRRPGYAYVYDSELDGTKTNGLSWLFDSYKWSLNGWRFGTRVEFSKFRASGNGRKWAYLWDVAHAPGKFEPFQMASHRIQYTVIINNNKR
jgi:hypothetical protein